MLINKFFYIAALTILCSCHNKDDGKTKSSKTGRVFFKYDQADYYRISFSETDIPNLLRAKSLSQNDSLKAALLIFDSPRSPDDTFFISKLDTLGFKHFKVAKEKFNFLDSLLIEQSPKDHSICTSETIFTDILVFRSHGKMTGALKFSCGCNLGYYTVGTSANTSNLGQDGEFDRLRKGLSQ